MTHPVNAFAEDAVAGRVVVSQWARLACERHLRDLTEGEARGLRFDEARADHVLGFLALLPQRKGKWQGQLLVLQPWQVFRLGCFFGWMRADGLRRFRVAFTEVPRNSGKTTEAAGVANYLAWFDSEPGAEVYCVSTKRVTARVCWTEAKWQMSYATDGKRLGDRLGLTLLAHQMDHVQTASKLAILGSEENEGDAISPNGYIYDELHAWNGPKFREFRDKLDTALIKREQPVKWQITTAGHRSSMLWKEERDYAMAVLRNTIQDDTYFAWISKVDDEARWDDEAEWYKANPNLGVTTDIETLRAALVKARHKPTELANAKRFFLGIQAEAENPWIDMALWDKQREPRTLKQLRKAHGECFLGLDLSSVRDITALCAVFPDGADACDVFWWFWVPGESIAQRAREDGVPYDVWRDEGHIEEAAERVIDYRKILARIEWLRKRFTVNSGAGDPWNLTEVERTLSEEGFLMLEVSQTVARLNAPTKEIERLLELGGFRHGMNPVARWMAGNAVTKSDGAATDAEASQKGRNYRLDKAKSTERIDGLAAAVNAVWAWQGAAHDDGPSVYETRGLVKL